MRLATKYFQKVFHQPSAVTNYAIIRFLFFVYLLIILFFTKINWLQFPELFPYLANQNGLFSFYNFTSAHLILIFTLTSFFIFLSALAIGGRIILFLSCLGFFIINSMPQAFNTLVALNTPNTFLILIFLFSPIVSPLFIFNDKSLNSQQNSNDSSWPIFYGQFIHTFFFFFSAVNKLHVSGISWLNNNNLKYEILCSPFRRGGDNSAYLIRNFVQDHLINSDFIFTVFAIIVIILELTAPLALISEKLKKWIIPILFLFQVSIYFSLSINPILSLAGYLFWIDWKSILSFFKKARV